MRLLVVDASAVAAVLFAEPTADEVVRRLDGLVLAAPSLLHYELASICAKKSRRDPDDAVRFRIALGRLKELKIRLTEVAPSDAAAKALQTGLTAYDASYLWLAHFLGAELVTLDLELAKAAAN
jgi:predicted nucleic acid-binding protein